MADDRDLTAAWWALRLGLGLGVLLAGVDKFFDRLAVWSMYLSPAAERLLPVSGAAFLRLAGAGEAALGLLILTRWPRLGGYALCAWMAGIVLNLALAGSFWDLVLRDGGTALAAFALARLSAGREERAAAIGRTGRAGARPATEEQT